jgi:hypothetical protein
LLSTVLIKDNITLRAILLPFYQELDVSLLVDDILGIGESVVQSNAPKL